MNEKYNNVSPNDTVIDELREIATMYSDHTKELAMAMAVYMLGFSTYMGFADKIKQRNDEKQV